MRLRECLRDIVPGPPRPRHDGATTRPFTVDAVWQLLHAATLEEGIVNTVMRGGDTDTNAAIAGALLGAVYGLDAIPKQWREKVLNCRPEAGREGVRHPRPKCFWPVDTLHIAQCLVAGGE